MFGKINTASYALNMLLVLFSQHLKPEKALNNYLCSGILELEAMVLFGMAYGRWILVYNSKVIYYK